MPQRIFGQAFTALLLLALLGGCQTWPASTPDLGQQFQAELDALHAEYGFPGATAAYVLPDGSVGTAFTGLADVEAGRPMQRRSRMLAASVGKTFVGATALALAREGRLQLDDPVARWLGDRPWFERLPNHDSMTLRHLLTHTAGIADHVYTEAFAQALAARWREPGNPFPPAALIGFILDQPPLFPPGESWSYSDTGYLLAGLIIERASGHSFYQEVARRFLVPLDLNLTSPSDRRDLPLLAAGYAAENHPFGLPVKTTTSPGVMAWNPAVEWAGGGFVSHPRDLARWAAALFGGQALEGEYLPQLLASVPVGGEGSGIRYGLGVGIYEDTPFGPSWGHGGGIPGYSSSLRYFPELGIAVAFQINTDAGINDDATPVVSEMEKRLTALVAAAVQP